MKQRALALIADYLSRRPIGRVVVLKRLGTDDYVVAIEDVRDERVHVSRTPRDFEPWLKSVKEGSLRPAGLRAMWSLRRDCDRDPELEIFRTCIPCQADLVELAVELHLETEVED